MGGEEEKRERWGERAVGTQVNVHSGQKWNLKGGGGSAGKKRRRRERGERERERERESVFRITLYYHPSTLIQQYSILHCMKSSPFVLVLLEFLS